jgi:biotin carboxyl carrier protein
MKYLTTVNGKQYEIEINQNGRVVVNGQERDVDFQALQSPLYSLMVNNASFEALVEFRDEIFNVAMHGNNYEITVADERAQRMAAARGSFAADTGEIQVRSPMPGLIVAIPVKEGQEVAKGDPLIVLESMKMENELKAPRAGTVHKISVAVGERVEQNKVLIGLA